MDLRREHVIVETDRHRIEGSLTLAAEGYRSRLSDYVNRRDVAFFTVQDATLRPHDGGDPWTAPVLMVASRHVRMIVPAAE